jgi:hypothetical protein
MTAGVDTSFDYHDDAGGKDPDKYSPTLRRHHQLLWSKELPARSGRFDLTYEGSSHLTHRSSLGTFHLASDAITTRLLGKASRAIREVHEGDIPEYLGYTAGSTIVFPGNKINKQMTINGARGCHPRIADRFDLTLECIRLHYLGRPNPLAKPLLRYENFFALFQDFNGYVEFFLLQDLVKKNGTICFFHPSTTDFSTHSAVPRTGKEYLGYLAKKNGFITARNARIDREP